MINWLCLPLSVFLFYRAIKGLSIPLDKKNDGIKFFTWRNINGREKPNPSQNEIDFRHFYEGILNILGGVISLVIFLKEALKLW
jgi:hypothetical protein